jgi:hypothetical protein
MHASTKLPTARRWAHVFNCLQYHTVGGTVRMSHASTTPPISRYEGCGSNRRLLSDPASQSSPIAGRLTVILNSPYALISTVRMGRFGYSSNVNRVIGRLSAEQLLRTRRTSVNTFTDRHENSAPGLPPSGRGVPPSTVPSLRDERTEGRLTTCVWLLARVGNDRLGEIEQLLPPRAKDSCRFPKAVPGCL